MRKKEKKGENNCEKKKKRTKKTCVREFFISMSREQPRFWESRFHFKDTFVGGILHFATKQVVLYRQELKECSRSLSKNASNCNRNISWEYIFFRPIFFTDQYFSQTRAIFSIKTAMDVLDPHGASYYWYLKRFEYKEFKFSISNFENFIFLNIPWCKYGTVSLVSRNSISQ